MSFFASRMSVFLICGFLCIFVFQLKCFKGKLPLILLLILLPPLPLPLLSDCSQLTAIHATSTNTATAVAAAATTTTRLSQSRSLGFLVWCGRTRHELLLARASRSQSRYALKSSTCEQVYYYYHCF